MNSCASSCSTADGRCPQRIKNTYKMRGNSYRKYLFYITLVVVMIVNYKLGCWRSIDNSEIDETNNLTELELLANSDNDISNAKYFILQWTSPRNVPFVYMGKGRQGFVKRNCPYTNCFVTSNKSLLGDYTKFDVIAFAGPELTFMPRSIIPKRRAPHQKYVFASIESAMNYPICFPMYNKFFNWTWTYKLDSDSKWGYFIIRDSSGKIVGPKKEMNWIKWKDMMPTSASIKAILRGKSKAAAWFVSHCTSTSYRERFAHNLKRVLWLKYNLTIDIYGACSELKCPRINDTYCDGLIRRDYYFYLAFENAFSEDYVTEKLVRATKNIAIPIVFGGANYSRFLPDHSYLNALEYSVQVLAKKMSVLIHNFEEYSEYFRWTRYYSYHVKSESVESDDYCGFCSLLNNDSKRQEITIYDDFQAWWNNPEAC